MNEMHKKITAVGVSIALSFAATAILGVPTSFARPLACADGGSCRVGETGPGGGIVFYYNASGFNCGLGFIPTGSPTVGLCHALEVAPTGGNTTWATNVYGNQTTAVTGADETAIGSGYQNSLDIVNQAGNDVGYSAAVFAYDYIYGGKSDWYLPSKDELNELCKFAKGQKTGDPSTTCADTRRVKSGFTAGYYWSSSEGGDYYAWVQLFNFGLQGTLYKDNAFYVRPIRAF
jgi:hypothetical protein